MKIRSLLLGSVAAAGLSTGAFAADLGVLTSLDVCDSLGLSGLTISSDTNCLQITGGVSYEFIWGDYQGNTAPGGPAYPTQRLAQNATVSAFPSGYDNYAIATPGNYNGDVTLNNDWSSRVEGWIKFVATADSDFGPAKAVIRLRQRHYRHTINEGYGIDSTSPADSVYDTYTHGDDTGYVQMNEAYVQIGDSTVIMAGRKGTLMNFGDDVPLNFLGLFHSEKVDTGAKWTKDRITDGGHVIQITSDLGNGFSVGAALEDLAGGGASAGTAVGVIAYAGDGIAAHLTIAADGILDGTVNAWGYHAGVSGSFDMFKFVAAVAGDDTGFYNAVGSASATFDMFTIALSGEAVRDVANAVTDFGGGASLSASVTDGVTINLGGRWYRDQAGVGAGDSYQAAVQVVAAVTESITLTGEVGVYGHSAPVAPMTANVFYGAGQVAWAPGGGFTSSLKGEVYSNGAYKATFKAAKTFE